MVPYERPELPWDGEPDSDQYRSLTLICRLSEPVDGLISWFTVRHHHYSAGKHWRRGVFLKHPEHGSEALLAEEDERGRDLRLSVRGPSPDNFFNVLREGLEFLIKRRWKGLGYELLVPCPGRLPDGTACSFEFKHRSLSGYREKGRPTIECHECASVLDVSELLTGFAQSDVPLAPQIQELSTRVEEIYARVDEVGTDVREVKAIIPEALNQLRLVVKAATAEVDDCPRLFTLVPEGKVGLAKLRFSSTVHRLTLWCEDPDHEHPWLDATYVLKRPKGWVVEIAPYATLVFKTLRLVVPVAGAAIMLPMTETEQKAARGDLDLMKAVAAALPTSDLETGVDVGERGLSRAEGAGLRALRAALLDVDPFQSFGGLRRRQAATGDWVWICPRHYSKYDPGLPVLPAQPSADS
jgi:hypothetical protein